MNECHGFCARGVKKGWEPLGWLQGPPVRLANLNSLVTEMQVNSLRLGLDSTVQSLLPSLGVTYNRCGCLRPRDHLPTSPTWQRQLSSTSPISHGSAINEPNFSNLNPTRGTRFASRFKANEILTMDDPGNSLSPEAKAFGTTELLCKMLHFLPLPDLLRCQRVEKRWDAIIRETSDFLVVELIVRAQEQISIWNDDRPKFIACGVPDVEYPGLIKIRSRCPRSLRITSYRTTKGTEVLPDESLLELQLHHHILYTGAFPREDCVGIHCASWRRFRVCQIIYPTILFTYHSETVLIKLDEKETITLGELERIAAEVAAEHKIYDADLRSNQDHSVSYISFQTNIMALMDLEALHVPVGGHDRLRDWESLLPYSRVDDVWPSRRFVINSIRICSRRSANIVAISYRVRFPNAKYRASITLSLLQAPDG
jgi:hypothetical protein